MSGYHLDLSKLSSVVPSLKDVAEYVEQAKELPKVVEL